MSAFTARYAHDPRKILFQYHPHIDLERELLIADLEDPIRKSLSARQEFDSVLHPIRSRLEADESWRLADHVVCASSFTKRSLIEAGAAHDTISVIPYGVDLPPMPAFAASRDFHVLFVGSGLYRKGLHHLLAAWKKARLPKTAKLTIVARAIEPDLLRFVQSAEGIDYRPGVGSAELDALYAEATLFAMPSLVEGFGQVFLEALSHGLPVLGTPNTCVPDLGTPEEGLFCTAPGQSEQLAADLETLAASLPPDIAIRSAARAVAERYSWATFRAGIAKVSGG